MAKELPYFKFNAAEWISGGITLEDLTTQGAFINICAYYWFKSGGLTITEIKRRLKLKQATLDALVNGNHIKVDGDQVEVSFLKEQFDERGHKSKVNSINGSKGGAPKGNKNAEKNNREQAKTTNIEENKKRKEKKEKREYTQSAFGFPFLSLEFKTVWGEWEQFRKELKKTVTPSTAKKQLKFLGGRPENEAIEIINQSITNGWTGLFDLKTNGKAQHTVKEKLTLDDLK